MNTLPRELRDRAQIAIGDERQHGAHATASVIVDLVTYIDDLEEAPKPIALPDEMQSRINELSTGLDCCKETWQEKSIFWHSIAYQRAMSGR